jgi:hemolysin III
MTDTQHGSEYPLGEEIANAITHGVGAIFGIVALVLMVVAAVDQANTWAVVAVSIYGATLIILFLASTLYHAIPHHRTRQVFKILDHCAIYLLIAGTYTPFLLVNMRDASGWWVFASIWSLAVLGIAKKLLFRNRFHGVSVAVYLLMGWFMLFAFEDLVASVSTASLVLLLSGGAAYTVGVVFYLAKRLHYNHAIWHLFVLAGAACHFAAVWLGVLS